MARRDWFVSRSVGYGWRPVSWQGWLVTAIIAVVPALVLIVTGASLLGVGLFLVALAAGFIALVAIAGWPSP